MCGKGWVGLYKDRSVCRQGGQHPNCRGHRDKGGQHNRSQTITVGTSRYTGSRTPRQRTSQEEGQAYNMGNGGGRPQGRRHRELVGEGERHGEQECRRREGRRR